MTAIIPLCKELLLYYSAYISTTTALSQPLNLSTPQPLNLSQRFSSPLLRTLFAVTALRLLRQPKKNRAWYEAGTRGKRRKQETTWNKKDINRGNNLLILLF
jgi:hypothetical protein